MFKFVHIADSHLDSPIVSNEKYREVIMEEAQRAFKAAITLCIDEKCNALLICGDLFDDDHLSFKTELMLRDSFEKLKKNGIEVFYSLGNHDPKSSKLRKFKLGENVHVFDSEEPETIEANDADGNVLGTVTGVGYPTKHVDYNLSNNFRNIGKDNTVPSVAMLHTSLDIGGEKVYAPCTYEDLAVLDYDYWALGHIHKTTVYGQEKPAIFPGCTCGRHFAETGSKGGYLVTLQKDAPPKAEFVELAGITWYDVVADGFDEATDAGDMFDICAGKIMETVNESKINFIRLTLVGQCPMYEKLSMDDIEDLENSLTKHTSTGVALVNKLESVINPDDYINDKHLLSIALSMAKEIKENPELKAQVMEILEGEYKGLDGGSSDEYIESLFENVSSRLCDVMIKK
ncbi:MAG: DNA repair exonuclease [Eubacteriales bacterium]